jgi:hypothetical protein
MKSFILKVLLLAVVLVTTGCATTPLVLLDFKPGATVESLSSSVSLSIHSSEHSMSGHGFMVFRKPDQLHLVVLSPFGTTLMEAFSLGDRITLVYPSQTVAYVGGFDELPEQGGLQGWRMMRWVMEVDAPVDRQLNGTVERLGKLGFVEKVTFENGLVTSKVSPEGDQVYYEKYKVFNGVPVATVVEMRNARDDRIRLTLDEPEVNTPLDDIVFLPRLEGMRVLPLSEVKVQ